MIRPRVGSAVVAATVCAAIAAGCGSSSSSSKSSSAGGSSSSTPAASSSSTSGHSSSLPEPQLTGIGPETGHAAAIATAAGIKAAKAAGPPVKLPTNKTVGFLQILGGIQSADRTANAANKALSSVGIKMQYCDGMGSPTQWVTCGNSLLNQGVNALFTTGITPNSIANVLSAAKAKNIPFLQGGGLVPPGYSGSYYPDEAKAGQVLASYLVKRLSAVPGTKQIAIADYPAPWASLRTDQLKAAVMTNAAIKIAASSVTDPTNLVAGTKSTTSNELTANPNLKAFWWAFDSSGQAGAQQVAQTFPGKTFPNKPLVVTFHADPATQDLMKSGAVDAVVDVNYDAGQWIAVDQLLEHWARGKPFSTSSDPKYPGVPDLFSYKIVTKANLPTTQYVEPNFDVVSFFTSKWKAEFGK